MKKFTFTIIVLCTLSNGDASLLREEALKYGLRSVPKSYEALLTTLKTNETYLSKDKIRLGKELFFDKNLSKNRDISCASCHKLDQGGVDGRPTAIGHKEQANPHHINTPTVLNTALSSNLFWDGSAKSLKEQAKGPLQASFEMNANPKLIEERVNEDSRYHAGFLEVYGERGIAFENIVDAIEAYEKTLFTRGKFDDFLDDNLSALNRKEQKGLKIFMDRGCVLCHSGTGFGGQLLRKFPLVRHSAWSDIGLEGTKELINSYKAFLANNPKPSFKSLKAYLGEAKMEHLYKGFFDFYPKEEQKKIITTTGCYSCHIRGGGVQISPEHLKKIAFPFKNVGEFMGKDNRYFRVPILRNITKTKPYFHNGITQELSDVIQIMSKYQLVKEMPQKEIDLMIEFLKTLEGEQVDYGVE